MKKICSIDVCTGCGVCSNICNRNAISMCEDRRGFLYPKVDSDKCVECGLCEKRCPANNVYTTESMQRVYACWNKNKTVKRKSTSGGMFSLIAEFFLDDGGYVIGCAWENDFSAKHICINDKKELDKLRGSKYLQSNMGDIYVKVKNLLDSGKKVLFSGTPCQVHGMRTFLDKDYENLYTVDLVCHGVPPYKMFKKHLQEVAEGDVDKITNVYLRYKRPSWNFGSVRIEMKNRKVYMRHTVSDAYFNIFNFNYSLRNSCHKCRYTNFNRTGDITLCDFWGFYPQSIKLFGYDKGVSGLIVNSQNGAEIFERIKNAAVYEKDSINRLQKGNKSLSEPFQAPEDVSDFWHDYENGMSVNELNEKYIKEPYKVPSLLRLRILKSKLIWIFKKG